MRTSVVIAMALALVFGGASAQGPEAQVPAASVSEASLHAYGDGDKSCQEWSDGCRSCSRTDKPDPTCSNIGIACQPKGITCARRTDPPK